MKDIHQLFREFIVECEYARKLRPETTRGYRAVFQLFLKVMPEITDIAALTPDMLNEFFRRIETRPRKVGKQIRSGVKKSTIKTQWSKLNVFFEWLCKRNYMIESPLKHIKAPRPNYDDFRRLEDSQINKIYSSVVRCSASPLIIRRDTLMVSLLLFCGIRKGEFISLQVKDIDLIKNEITIRAETSKSKKTRVLTMHPTLILHLKDYLKERKSLKTELLIVSSKKDEGLTRHGLKHWVKSLIVRSGVRFHLHQFRHTFACKLCEANVNVFKVQKLMGHTEIAMTMRYARSMRTEDMTEDIGKISI
ncbi:tyrosine-type recombinase/integrase [Mucilaginibacter boryungensis]|uniref:Tyrosine-type recombinase/integrase n=1 Tax=Mucilaginibacter boryungensis TaxID=768480 RepID=A0ABR9XLX6_9SPHI|nr:tyrosine-type recombinase/integrase [Mucilaginibacter boryungensis]MBE9668212.1 tyrosine-type recombinase/integrase [Mucilaginibacter boryungensis]